MREEGATLIEVLLAAAVSVLMAAALFSLPRASHPFEASPAAGALRAQIAYAQSLAASDAYGASLVFAAAGSGFTATLYRGSPDAPGGLRPSGWPPYAGSGSIRVKAAGQAPFTLVFSSAGRAALAGAAGCPEPGRISLLLGEGSGHVLELACFAP